MINTKYLKFISFVFFMSISFAALANESVLESCKNNRKLHDASISLAHCKDLLAELDRKKYPVIATKLLMILHDIHNEMGEVNIAQNYLTEIKNSKMFTDNEQVKYIWYRQTAIEYLYSQKYTQAKKYFTNAFLIAENKGQDEWLAKSYNDLAIIFKNENNYLKALNYYEKSLVLKEKLGNDFYIAVTLNNIAHVYKSLEKYQQSQDYFELALERLVSYTSKNDDLKALEYLSHIYQSLALVYNLNDEHQKQRFYSEKIIDYYKKTLNTKETVYGLIVLTRLHLSANEFKPAKQFIEQLTLLKDSNEHPFQDEIYLLKSKLALNDNNELQAIEYIEQSIKFVENKDQSMIKKEIYHYASELYLTIGRPYEAITFLKKYQYIHEQLLEQKYNENTLIKQSEIENERIARRLLDQKVVSQNKQQKINELINIGLFAMALLLVLVFLVILYVVKKRKNQQHLLTIIESHKQQLFLLNKTEQNSTQEVYDDNSLAELLVSAMHDCLCVWEKATNTNKVELADRSKIWKISVDEGRLRTRSLDKYLSLKKLPENPRWRSVVKTCHFILAECQLDKNDRDLLTQRLNNIMSIIKNQSMEI